MDRVQIGPVKGLKIAIAAFVLSLALAALVIGGGIYYLTTRNADTESFSKALRNGLIESCQTNGNPLRAAVQDQIRERIKQRETLDFSRFFPDVPPAELHRLLSKQNTADRRTLKRIAPVDCVAQYPRP